MKLKKRKKIIIIIVAFVAVLIFIAACSEEKVIPAPCVDVNYSDDHAVNVAMCLQSLEDGSAYELDEALTAKAPWKVGEIIGWTNGGEGPDEYYIREFLGVTKAGYYLVQDFLSSDKQKKTFTNTRIEPLAFMSLCGAQDMHNIIGTAPSACGNYTSYHDGAPGSPLKEQGLYLAGRKHGQWIGYYSSGHLRYKANYEGYAKGFSIYFDFKTQLPNLVTYYDHGGRLFQIRSEKDKPAEIWQRDPNALVVFNENNQTIQYGLLTNGEKTGIWRKWDFQGVLLEEIDYN